MTYEELIRAAQKHREASGALLAAAESVQAVARFDSDSPPMPDSVPPTPRTKKARMLARKFAMETGCLGVNNLHEVIGHLQLEESPLLRALEAIGVDAKNLREKLISQHAEQQTKDLSSGFPDYSLDWIQKVAAEFKTQDAKIAALASAPAPIYPPSARAGAIKILEASQQPTHIDDIFQGLRNLGVRIKDVPNLSSILSRDSETFVSSEPRGHWELKKNVPDNAKV